MTPETIKFSWKWLDLGDRRLAWTWPGRRPASLVAAADLAKAFLSAAAGAALPTPQPAHQKFRPKISRRS